jgi:hypothetical protein
MFFIKKLKRENNVEESTIRASSMALSNRQLGWWPKTINKRKEIESTGTRA